MSRHVVDAPITTPTSRSKLPVRAKPYFRSLDPKLCLGYRKSKNGGRWLIRAYDGNGRYHQEEIGIADDHQKADGTAVLDFGHASKLAHDRYTRRFRRRRALPEHPDGSFKVKDSCADYLKYLAEEKKSEAEVKRLFNAYVFRHSIAEFEGDDLTQRIVVGWRNEIAKLPPRRRPKRGKSQYAPFDPKDPEQVRRRRATANTLFIYLRAALNHSWRAGDIASDMAWRKIKPFPETDQPRVRYLELIEVPHFVSAAKGALRRFLTAGAVTGARPSELARLQVRDYHEPSGKLHVTKSKSGRQRHIVLNDEGQMFFHEICRGRKRTDLMLVRDDGTPWDDNYGSPTKRAATDAGFDDVTFYTLRHTYCSHAVMNGMPLTVLAKNLGHVDTRMVEKHYGHLSPDYVSREIRRHAPTFGVVDAAVMDTAP